MTSQIILLDIDGVILPETPNVRPRLIRPPFDQLIGQLADATPTGPVSHLITLTQVTGARFVLISSWRGLFPENLIKTYLERIGLWPYYFHRDWAAPMRGLPPRPNKGRDIGMWLTRNRVAQRHCLVIDDHNLGLREVHGFRILQQLRPMPEVGFSRLDLHRALSLLSHPVSYAEQVLTPAPASA